MNIIEDLIEIFRKFPGVGPRQAERFVYYLLRQKKDYLKKISSLLPHLNEKIQTCRLCQRFYLSENAKNDLCDICLDGNRDSKILMIVGQDVDLQAIERSRNFNGRYFVLGGLVPVLEKNVENRIRLAELKKSLEGRNKKDNLQEIILALDANPEGENTTSIIKKEIEKFTEKNNIKISVLGRGLSTGTELEYSDSETIKNALKNRF
ncbi:MAG TPA: toprim domain-containing protein [Candidatus Paceibacterota bacterium]|nr:toprim domain-containing protein [Candidatus Paceibacterota bacterium]HRZ34572.1 toprim domain-containing protein [Candidatus Paceibacterota bacterium]